MPLDSRGADRTMRSPSLNKSYIDTSRFPQSQMPSSSLAQSDLNMEEDIQISIGGVQFLLIPCQENLLGLEDSNAPAVALVRFPSRSFVSFRVTTLDEDDVFRPEFYRNVVFYGSKEEDLHIAPDTLEELVAWNTKTWTYVEGNSAVEVPPGPLESPSAGTNGRVIVPSRCYYQPSESRPLDGARISVKDNIDIAGHKTTLCNRAWQDLYPTKTKNAACVQVLIDAGAVIVGKVKLQAMIMREEPLEAVEFTAPFNPRGDGYQVPSGSSHGSAASIGSYEQFDMPVFFGRDLSRFFDFISVWYGESPMLRTPSELPVKILYPKDYLPTPNAAQSILSDKFVKGLESALQVKREEISLAELWKRDCPDGPDHADIAEYLKLDSYYDLAAFGEEYEEKHGKPPFVHRAMHWQWNISKTISLEERNMYWRRSEIYRHWLLDKVFEADRKDSTTIMIFPIEVGKPNYRDAELPSVANSSLVGEITYESTVTKRNEPLPIGASVIGAPGTDLVLLDLVGKGMKAGGFPTKLKTGRFLY
ncbi:hypothetical protein H2202_010884 [Exophiala xenobiotica]|nr:hypothetical protein H2202_010884 [Exophiala xenobiotica]